MAQRRRSTNTTALSPGDVADITLAVPLLDAASRPERLIADKAWDADRLRAWLERHRVEAVIPSTASRTPPYALDRRAFERRNLIERLFCRPKTWRRIATRHDRLARNVLPSLALVAIVAVWAE